MPSYAHGAWDTALIGRTIGADLERSAQRFGEREALVSCAQGIRMTYAELDAAVDRVARGLLAMGIERGDRVGIWSPNCAEWVLVQYGTAKLGASVVNIHQAYRTHELGHVLKQAGISLLVSATEFKTSDYRAIVAEVRAESPDLCEVVFIGGPAWERLMST